jgi:hypothetical protein|tara:strand:+ start:569 stop:988 length:420 start_codon:yes stop_codon:yes gene_type:complete
MRLKTTGTEEDYEDFVNLAGNLLPPLYDAVGVDISDTSKKTIVAQVRAAVGVALYKHFPAPCVADAMDIHRDSITQYAKKHPLSLIKWKGYEEAFLIIQSTLDSTIGIETALTNIDNLSRRITKLTDARTAIETMLNER